MGRLAGFSLNHVLHNPSRSVYFALASSKGRRGLFKPKDGAQRAEPMYGEQRAERPPRRRRIPRLWLVDVIHRVQCERGASCAMVASGGATAESSMVASLRSRTDQAISAGARFEALASTREEVEARLRTQRLSDDQATGLRDASAFYIGLTAYTECVALLLARVGDASRAPSPQLGGTLEQPSVVHALVGFCQLKESVAWQRGFLTGALALPQHALSELPPRAFAALVLCLGRQREQKERLEATTPPRLLELLRTDARSKPSAWPRQLWPPHSSSRPRARAWRPVGAPLGSGAELRPFGPRSAAREPLRGAAPYDGVTATQALGSRPTATS